MIAEGKTRVSYIDKQSNIVIDIVDLDKIEDARSDVLVVEGIGSNIGDTWDGEKFISPPQPVPPPTSEQVSAERDRRISSGFNFGGKLFDSRPDDQTNIAGASQMAFMAIVAGAQPGNLRWHGGASDFGWITHDNTIVTMDAQTVVNFGKTAAAWKQAHIFAGRALKDMDPTPADFAEDKWWPGV